MRGALRAIIATYNFGNSMLGNIDFNIVIVVDKVVAESFVIPSILRSS